MDETASDARGNWWQRIQAGLRRRGLGARSRRLRLCETLPLGDRRFVALIQVDDREYLVGASAAQVQLLAELRPKSSSPDLEPGTAGVDCPALSVN